MPKRLDDKDVDQIAQRVVTKLLLYGALLLAALWLAPLLAIGLATFVNGTIRDGSSWFALPLTTTLVALPIFFAMLVWSSSRRQR